MNRSQNPNRGRGRGRGQTARAPKDPDHPHVPAFFSIHPGTPVAIILKQDQPTGHRVYGIVSELLTHGDHPRGVKVRLRDGRVGRVQSVVDETKGKEGEGAAGGENAGLGRDGEVILGETERGRESGMGGRGGFRHVQDVREDGYLWDEREAPREYFADVQFKVKAQKKGKRKGGAAADAIQGLHGSQDVGKEDDVEVRAELAICPVCGAFEGDEMAVAHHVEQHFSEG